MNKKRCLNCGGKFSPNKHIVNQRYCSKKRCQKARVKKWVERHKHNKTYKANRREIHSRWRSNNPEYYKKYTKNVSKKIRTPKTDTEKPILKLLVGENILTNLQKAKIVDCNCRLILICGKTIKD
jgi:hypothetical protein